MGEASCRIIGWDAGEQTACGLWVDQQRGYLVHLSRRAKGRQRSDIIRMQRTGDAAAEQRQRAIQCRYCLGVENSLHTRGAQHLEEMAEKAEPGHVGACCGPMVQQAPGCWRR